MNTASKPKVNPRTLLRQKFCEKHFEFEVRQQWLDVVCFVPMSHDRVARIELSDVEQRHYFTQLDVRIIHTRNGVIDSKTFHFEDWLHDEREDSGARFEVLYDLGDRFDWLAARPSTAALHALTGAVVDYVAQFETDESGPVLSVRRDTTLTSEA